MDQDDNVFFQVNSGENSLNSPNLIDDEGGISQLESF